MQCVTSLFFISSKTDNLILLILKHLMTQSCINILQMPYLLFTPYHIM